jgi:cell division protein FtsZ
VYETENPIVLHEDIETEAPVYFQEPIVAASLDTVDDMHDVFHFELSMETPETIAEKAPEVVEEIEIPVAKTELEELVNFTVSDQPAPVNTHRFFGGLNKPNNIYAETETAVPSVTEVETVVAYITPKPVIVETPIVEAVAPIVETIVEEESMQLVMKEEVAEPVAKAAPVLASAAQEDAYLDESEEQKRRAAERIQKLRNLSFNMNTTDPNNEFDSVPAYIRRNMELFGNTLTSVENFYSKVTVGKDANNQTQLSTINSFLDGKKPD